MQIKYLGRDKFEIKTKEALLFLGEKIVIDGFELSGSGEYEKSSIFIEGISDNGHTIYAVKAEDIRLCYMGKISHMLKENEAKAIGDVDILFVPLGEEGSLSLNQALNLISIIDPKIVIPMLYSDLDQFKKSEGAVGEALDSLKIKKADLPEDERRVVVLKAAS